MKSALEIVAVFVLLVASAAAAQRPPLVDAARNADKDQVRALVQQGANVNAADADGTTALHWASYRDDLEIAELLIRAGARVNAANDLGATPLWTASQNGSATMVRRLLEAGANPDAPLLSGETPLMVAARSGSPACVEQLLAKGAQVNAHATRGQTALMWAVAQKHADVVKVLLAHGVDVHARSDAWSEVMAVPPHGHLEYNRAIPHGRDTALMFAARVGDVASATLLVSAGANVNDADAWGVSATAMAAHAGYGELVALLLDHGADPNASAAGFAPLHAAILRRDERMVGALLAHGADANAPLRTWTPTRRSSHDFNFSPELVGATPFWLAARFSEPGVMRLLIKHGADPLFVHHGDHVVEARGGEAYEHRVEVTNALMAATGMGGGTAWVQPGRAERETLTLEAVTLAAELGVDVNAANTDGRTALDAARALKYDAVGKFLVEKGAKPGTRRKN
ncbi:MAG TPA: ankyrin repeat domain-containing protein [Vicinamibacterales bacterium]|nr:ankyrin repeat domain-containing protein [Vicinamibacterales bacterium]